MAWAAVQDITVTGVAFDKSQLAFGDDVRLVEIDDRIAGQVLQGHMNLQQCLHPGWPRYPASMGPEDMATFKEIAGLIKPHAIAVEIGSLCGGSARLLLDSTPSIKRLYCFDRDWADAGSPIMQARFCQDILAAWNVHQYGTTYDFAKSLLKDYDNVRLLPMSSPYDVQSWWTESIDFLYEDSTHCNPQLRDNLDFWVPFVRSGGIIAGDDYLRYPDVQQEAVALAERLNAVLHTHLEMWWIIKP